MLGRIRLVSKATLPFGLIVLLFASVSARAADNIWQSTFGQGWFYEVRSSSNELLAGTWWENSLTPGNTYNIRFNVKSLKGRFALLVGNNTPVTISKPGSYSFDFNISSGGKRRMLFRTASNDVAASVNGITVSPKSSSSTQAAAGGSTSLPRGHYLGFDRERNLKNELAIRHKSNYHLNVARNLEQALNTPGVKGMWMQIDWRTLEVGDGRFNWALLDANMAVARQFGLKLIVAIADRSFNGSNVLPAYFPSKYVLWSSGGGKSGVVAKRWDPWVYNRLIRLHKAIASRYANEGAFGGIATSETATGNFSGGDYNVGKYRTALTQIVNQTHAALKRGKLFLYMNFLRGGDNSDMNRDVRVALLKDVPHGKLAIGGPDITPDVQGMPRSATAYRIHVRKKMPNVDQFCHLQHVDQGLGGVNKKSNRYRQQYLDEVARVRSRERQSWFRGTPAVFEFDDLRDPKGNKVKLHPGGVLGKLWHPNELLSYAKRNFACDYVLWHYRERANSWNEFIFPDIRPVILNNQYL